MFIKTLYHLGLLAQIYILNSILIYAVLYVLESHSVFKAFHSNLKHGLQAYISTGHSVLVAFPNCQCFK